MPVIRKMKYTHYIHDIYINDVKYRSEAIFILIVLHYRNCTVIKVWLEKRNNGN